MKTLFYIVLVSIVLASCGASSVDKKVANIESDLSQFKKDSVFYQDAEKYYLSGSYTAYLDKNTVVKLIEYAGEEGFIVTNSYYFDKGKLIYLLIQSTDAQDTNEEKYLYFEGTDLVKALHKIKKSDNKQAMKAIQAEPDTALTNDLKKSSKIYLDLTKTAAENYKLARNQK